MENKVFWATGIHLLIPSVLRPKRKNKTGFFLRAIHLRRIKGKHVYHITRHIWLRLLYKKPPPIFASAALRQTSNMPKH